MFYKIVLADDHTLFRDGLKGLIDKESAFKVVAQAADGDGLLDQLNNVKCDLVVLDISMPNRDGLSALREIHKKYPQVKILILSMLKDPEHFKVAMTQGASGYLLKDDAYDQLIMAMKMILRGKQYVSPGLSSLIAEKFIRSADEVDIPSLEILTKREKQILKMIAQGAANKNIASKLNISVRTAESHRIHLTDKLGIKNTAGLVKFAISKGLV